MNVILSMAALSGCSSLFGDKDMYEQGEPLGQYQMTATTDVSSTCKEIVASAPSPWIFNVSLRRDAATAIWLSGGEPMMGTVDSDGSLAFSYAQRVLVRAQGKGRNACVVYRTDRFSGKLAGSVDSTDGRQSLSGVLSYSYSLEPGSDCSEIVASQSTDEVSMWTQLYGLSVNTNANTAKMFSMMPCDAKFQVKATRIGDVPKYH